MVFTVFSASKECFNEPPRLARLVLLLSLPLLVSACADLAITAGFTSSASLASSATSSNAVSSPFRSSANSSAAPPKQPQRKAEEEVEIYTAYYFQAGGGSAESFLSSIARIAARHGFSDWESIPGIWISVGRGMGIAGLDRQQAAYARAWLGVDENNIAGQQQAYLSSTQ